MEDIAHWLITSDIETNDTYITPKRRWTGLVPMLPDLINDTLPPSSPLLLRYPVV